MSISNDKKDLNLLSLFSGCGGMDLGFEGGFSALRSSVSDDLGFIESRLDDNIVRLKQTRFKIVFANDILGEACATWRCNFAKYGYSYNVFHKESIVDLVKRHRGGQTIFPPNVDIVTGGFPCQDFSVSGKRRGFDSHKDHTGKTVSDQVTSPENRGRLYLWMREVIEITRPKIFIAENVKGLTNLNDVRQVIENDFSQAGDGGYIVLPHQVLQAARYGVPQSRERVIFIGVKRSALKKKALQALTSEIIPDRYNPYPKPTHSYNDQQTTLKRPVILGDILSLLQEPNRSGDISQQYYSKAKYMGRHCQGQIEISFDGIAPTIRSEHHGNIEYRRLSKEHGGVIDNELSQGLEERRLTPRECGMIQTFPADFEFVIPSVNSRRKFCVSPSAAYKVVGNAVPPLLAYNIAKRIEAVWPLYFN